ncbi:MAG: protein phosphatase 2C domain-containing protein [Ktedonobacteraceae bacterium]
MLYNLIISAGVGHMRRLLQLVKRLLGLEKSTPSLDHLLRINAALQTDVGRKRSINEDSMASVIPDDPHLLLKKGALFVVADGLGGHTKGEVASKMTVEAVCNVYYQDEQGVDVAAHLLHTVQRANEVIYHQIDVEDKTSFGAMGSTCTAAVLHDNIAYIANVGDSRAYIIRHEVARQISLDHSWVAEQVRAGKLTPEQGRGHARGNIITRCLGTHPDVEVDIFVEPLKDGDVLLLCSDGLSNLVRSEELSDFVLRYEPLESVAHLVVCANERGGTDNITAIVVRVGQGSGVSTVSEVVAQQDSAVPFDTDSSDDASNATRELRALSNGETSLR